MLTGSYVLRYHIDQIRENGCVELDADVAELTGAIMGDGNIWTNFRWYEVTITGDKEKDAAYFKHLAAIVQTKIGRPPYIRIRGGLRLTIKSKEFFYFLTGDLGISSGIEKAECGIPARIIRDNKFALRFVRGVFDTDGSVFTSEKRGSPAYPTIEVTNANKALVADLQTVLERNGFRPRIRFCKGVYKIALNDREKIAEWRDKISSSNTTKLAKMDEILYK